MFHLWYFVDMIYTGTQTYRARMKWHESLPCETFISEPPPCEGLNGIVTVNIIVGYRCSQSVGHACVTRLGGLKCLSAEGYTM